MAAYRIVVAILFTSVAFAHSTEIPPLVLEAESAKPGSVKIVLVAGPKLTKTKSDGEHAYLPGCRVLAALLAQTPGVSPVVVDGGWPTKPETFTNAKAVLFFGDGGGVQPMLKGDRLATIGKMVDAGVGLVCLHQNADYPKDLGDRARSWLGGCFEPKHSLRAHWVTKFDKFPDHPICRGVTPFTIDDGWLYKTRFVEGMTGVTPILRTKSPKEKAKLESGDDIVCWAYDRPTGGRSFVFTGAHLHQSFQEAGYRRLLTNGLLWAAGTEVPAGGAKVELDTADLPKYLLP